MRKRTIESLDEIGKFLKDNQIDFHTERNNYCINAGTSREVEIEYVDSLDYPMAQKALGLYGVPKDYFYRRSREYEDRGSFALWIKDYEWSNPTKKEILKSYILHFANKTPTRIYARDTEVKVFTNAELRSFQEENCFYGYRSASLCLGLVLKKDIGELAKGTLLMVTTFGRNFFGKKEDLIEVYRVGTLKNTQVVGGSSKLMSYFIKNYPTIKIGNKDVEYSKIVYYVDYDHGKGGSLEKLGFDFVGYSGGGFMNMDLATGAVSHRQPMKHKEIMTKIANGEMIAVPNAGVKIYEFSKMAEFA
jgi:hypothetical protein